MATTLRARQRLGKYRIDRKVAAGAFAVVYSAFDSIEGIRVALKIPHERLVDDQVLSDFRREARLSAQLDHPNILNLKNASFIDDHFVLVYPMGRQSLAERLRRRISFHRAFSFAEQMLDAVACAHRSGIIHCDVKPENFILFDDDRLRLGDFGIARVARGTVSGSGSGTVGYMAPEQAMGKTSLRSDVFSLGLVIYRMFSGQLPEWPFTAPLAGIRRLRSKLHPETVDVLLRALDVNPRRRFADAVRMQAAFARTRRKALLFAARRRSRQR